MLCPKCGCSPDHYSNHKHYDADHHFHNQNHDDRRNSYDQNDQVSSHILDTTLGKPAAGVVLTFSRLVNNNYDENGGYVEEEDKDYEYL